VDNSKIMSDQIQRPASSSSETPLAGPPTTPDEPPDAPPPTSSSTSTSIPTSIPTSIATSSEPSPPSKHPRAKELRKRILARREDRLGLANESTTTASSSSSKLPPSDDDLKFLPFLIAQGQSKKNKVSKKVMEQEVSGFQGTQQIALTH